MAGPFNPPVRAEDFAFTIGLEDYANPGTLKSAPTLAAGDVKVRVDGGAWSNISALPVATLEGVYVTLTAGEMTGYVVDVKFIDQTAPPEWCSDITSIITTT